MAKSVDLSIVDDCGIVYLIEQMANGTYTAEARVTCTAEINGRRYSGDRIVRFKLHAEAEQPEP
jgi:hypothetical protein